MNEITETAITKGTRTYFYKNIVLVEDVAG